MTDLPLHHWTRKTAVVELALLGLQQFNCRDRRRFVWPVLAIYASQAATDKLLRLENPMLPLANRQAIK